MGRAGDGHVVEGVGDVAVVGARAEPDLVEVLQHDHRRGQLVAGHGRHDRRPPALGVPGDQRARPGRRRPPGTRGVRPRRQRAAVPRSVPSGARTTTRSSPPAQPGSAGPGQATNGTGHHGSSTARSSRESGPAATMARGRAASRAVATAAAIAGGGLRSPRGGRGRRPRRARAGGRRRVASAASSSSRDSSNQVGHRQPHGPSGRPAGLVDQQHRDVVAHGVGQAAAAGRPAPPPPARAAPWPSGQTMISISFGSRFMRGLLIRARTSSRTRVMVASSAPSTLRRSNGSVLDGRTLNHQSSVVDGEAVEVVDRGARPSRRTPSRRSPSPPRGRRPRS